MGIGNSIIFLILKFLSTMELNEFVTNFAAQFDDTDPSEIQAETAFRDLDEWSSLVGMISPSIKIV